MPLVPSGMVFVEPIVVQILVKYLRVTIRQSVCQLLYLHDILGQHLVGHVLEIRDFLMEAMLHVPIPVLLDKS